MGIVYEKVHMCHHQVAVIIEGMAYLLRHFSKSLNASDEIQHFTADDEINRTCSGSLTILSLTKRTWAKYGTPRCRPL